MWFGIIIFGIGFLGLVALFVCKAFELRRAATTPLSALRRNGDHLVTERWRRLKGAVRSRAARLFDEGCARCKTNAHEAAARLHAAIHSLSVRFGEYLKRNGVRGASAVKNGKASSYMKNMLEYKQHVQKSDMLADSTPVVSAEAKLRGTARIQTQMNADKNADGHGK